MGVRIIKLNLSAEAVTIHVEDKDEKANDHLHEESIIIIVINMQTAPSSGPSYVSSTNATGLLFHPCDSQLKLFAFVLSLKERHIALHVLLVFN